MFHHKKPYKRVLFITKFRETSDGYSHSGLSSGLYNSARFICDMLNEHSENIDARIAQVIDNNSIDAVVTDFRPDIVIIEALWVVPDKFKVLKSLHPHVKWVIRLHSDTPFAASEGIFIEWCTEYLQMKNVYLNVNSRDLYDSFVSYFKNNHLGHVHHKISYLENYYPVEKIAGSDVVPYADKNPDAIDIGCFGAIRPLKNQLIQALAAIQYADKIGKRLNFHINNSRKEMAGSPAYRNIVNLFSKNPRHTLVEHAWLPHDQFLNVMAAMDICMQVSYSETFNIVAADAVALNIPVLVSDQIEWVSPWFTADPNSTSSIVRGLARVSLLSSIGLQKMNKSSLKNQSKQAKERWLSFLTEF